MAGPYLNTGLWGTQLTQADTTPKEELGIWRWEAGKVLRYVKAGALIPRYESVKFDTAVTVTAALFGNQVVQTSGPTDMFLGVADGATLALNSYGWITFFGPATARVAAGEIPATGLGPSSNTGVLSVRNTSHFNAVAIAIASGLSAGSAIFVSQL